MLYKFLRFLQLCLPFGLVLYMYKSDKALPANIKTRTGRNLKAIMLTTEYGLLFGEEVYIKNRTKVLKQQQKEASLLSDELLAELNSLSFEERERLAHGDDTE